MWGKMKRFPVHHEYIAKQEADWILANNCIII